MSILEILLLGVGLSMDAFAVGITNGMTDPHMRARKAFLIAGTYGGFQFLMPLAGYYFGSAFSELVARIAPYLSFGLLALIGGKMIFDCLREKKNGLRLKAPCGKPLKIGKLAAQGVATSLDALAVGVTLIAQEITRGLPVHVVLCALLIGMTTLALSLVAVQLGKIAGSKLSDRAEAFGGAVLVAIGVKLLCEGIL